MFNKVFKNEKGQGLVEYALIAIPIGLVLYFVLSGILASWHAAPAFQQALSRIPTANQAKAATWKSPQELPATQPKTGTAAIEGVGTLSWKCGKDNLLHYMFTPANSNPPYEIVDRESMNYQSSDSCSPGSWKSLRSILTKLWNLFTSEVDKANTIIFWMNNLP